MGMYDILGDGEQVKCFRIPTFYDSDIVGPISTMGGMLNAYKIGDEVPWRAWCYNYTKDFMIIDPAACWEQCPDCFHVVIDGKYVGTWHAFDEIPEELLHKVKRHVTYTGELIDNISDKASLEEYYKAFKERWIAADKAYDKAMPAFHEFLDIVRNGSDKEIEEARTAYDSFKNEVYADADKISKTVKDKYHATEQKIQAFKRFGMLIDCLKHYSLENLEEWQYEKLLKVFSESMDRGIDLKSYFKWNQMPAIEQEELLQAYNCAMIELKERGLTC